MYQNGVATSELVQNKANSKARTITYLIIKRIFDVVVGIIGLLFLLPIIVIVKIMFILTGDFHSIFLTQNRIGKNGKEFKFYKFRSMVLHADEILFQLLEENEEIREEYQKNKKLVNDPRITKVGKILRKTSLDELPQLLNVIKGDMSLVGNRPYLPREKDDMGEHYQEIIKTKPGITGYWQVNGRSDVSFERRLKLESYYSNHCSLDLDIRIFFRTFKVVLFGKNAK